MKRIILIAGAVSLTACSTVGSYLDGGYNNLLPPVDSPPDTVALISRSTLEHPDNVLVAVDGAPIMVNPEGDGNGMWAKQVAVMPGAHTVISAWRHPGQYSPASLQCTADFQAGHQYILNYEVTGKAKARMWVTDAADGQSVSQCAANIVPPSPPSWPFGS